MKLEAGMEVKWSKVRENSVVHQFLCENESLSSDSLDMCHCNLHVHLRGDFSVVVRLLLAPLSALLAGRVVACLLCGRLPPPPSLLLPAAAGLPISPAVFALRIGETGEEWGRDDLLLSAPGGGRLRSEGRRKRMEPRADWADGDWAADVHDAAGGGSGGVRCARPPPLLLDGPALPLRPNCCCCIFAPVIRFLAAESATYLSSRWRLGSNSRCTRALSPGLLNDQGNR